MKPRRDRLRDPVVGLLHARVNALATVGELRVLRPRRKERVGRQTGGGRWG